jgi:ApaG protein
MLETALKAEDFRQCALLRDQLSALRAADPVLRCRQELAEAVQKEEWEAAARLRDRLLELAPPPARVACSTSLTTHGVNVTVKSQFVRSDERQKVHLFSYEVTFTNSGPVPVQLLARHWVIVDSTGRMDHVRGPGVVGQQPVLAPGASFTYSSFCPLRTTTGTMEGEFTFVELPGESSMKNSPTEFQVPVQRFGLALDGSDVPMPPVVAQESSDTQR